MNAAVQTGDGCFFGRLGPCLKGARFIAEIVVRVIDKGDVPEKVMEDLEAAPDWTECPEVYSGKGGVVTMEVQPASIRSRMTEMGRIRLYSYLVHQQETKASNMPIPIRA